MTFTCQTEKPINSFFKSKTAKRGHYSECKECTYERAREYRKKNWARCYETRKKYKQRNRKKVASLTRKSALKTRYGITPERYQELLKQQNYRCGICGIHEDEVSQRSLCVDHCHNSNQVRGLLCDKCNRGIGAFNDDPELISKAAEFIDAFMETLEQ
jgi:hypothetical protein